MVNIVIKGLYFGNEIAELKTEYLLVFTLQLATVIQVDEQCIYCMWCQVCKDY